MVLTYCILYYFLQRYLSRNKNWMITTGLLTLFIFLIAFFNYFTFVLAFYVDTQVGFFKTMPGMDFIIPRWSRATLFNYPTIIGFALAIKLLKNWYIKQEEADQVAREKINAELQLLKAQVHPHFLFNTLNNIYSFIINDSPAAPEILKKLSALLHYLIYECDKPMVKLEDELKMIKGYIDLEKIRYGDNFNMSLQIQGTPGNKMIHPLFLIPFLENSFKHGTSQMLTHPWINLEIFVEKDLLHFNLSNSKPALLDETTLARGLGLSNVKKRLAILYPGMHSLNIAESIMSFNVELKIPLYDYDERQEKIVMKQQAYELV
jgi:LytS/YehU family sensor histidine kinase